MKNTRGALNAGVYRKAERTPGERTRPGAAAAFRNKRGEVGRGSAGSRTACSPILVQPYRRGDQSEIINLQCLHLNTVDNRLPQNSCVTRMSQGI